MPEPTTEQKVSALHDAVGALGKKFDDFGKRFDSYMDSSRGDDRRKDSRKDDDDKRKDARGDDDDDRRKDASEDEDKDKDGKEAKDDKRKDAKRGDDDDDRRKDAKGEGEGEGEGEKEGEEDKEKEKPKELAADDKRKDRRKDDDDDDRRKDAKRRDDDDDDRRKDDDDARRDDEGMDDRRRDDSRKDSALERRLDRLERENREHRNRRILTDEDLNKLAEAQQSWDGCAQAHGERASRPLDGERLETYERRHAKRFQKHSTKWSKIDLSLLPVEVLRIAAPEIRADAVAAAYRGDAGQALPMLREIRKPDRTGRMISEFIGPVSATLAPFRMPPARVKQFNRDAGIY